MAQLQGAHLQPGRQPFRGGGGGGGHIPQSLVAIPPRTIPLLDQPYSMVLMHNATHNVT